MLTVALSVLATVLTVARGWPQTSRIAIHKNVSGVSSLTWSLMLAAHMSWIVWAGNLGVLAVVIANILAAASCAAVLLTMSQYGQLSRLRPAWTAAVSCLLSLLLLRVGGSSTVSIALTVLTAGMTLPQVAKAFRTDASGVSPATWWLSAATSVIWPTYYALIHHPVLMAPNFVILPASLLILTRVYFVRSSARQPVGLQATPNPPN